jgi:hypothetical protein
VQSTTGVVDRGSGGFDQLDQDAAGVVGVDEGDREPEVPLLAAS